MVCDKDDENEGGEIETDGVHRYSATRLAEGEYPVTMTTRRPVSSVKLDSELESDVITAGPLSHLASYRFRPRDSDVFDFSYTPSASSTNANDTYLSSAGAYDKYSSYGRVRSSHEDLLDIEEDRPRGGGSYFGANSTMPWKMRSVSPRLPDGDDDEGSYYDNGTPSYYCTLRYPKKSLATSSHLSSLSSYSTGTTGGYHYRPKSAVINVSTPALDALSKTYNLPSATSYNLVTSSLASDGGSHVRGSEGLSALNKKDDQKEFRSKFLRKVRQKKAAGETVMPSGEKKSRFLKK